MTRVTPVTQGDPKVVDQTKRLDKGGIVNRGDSFRRRRSRSGSLAPSSPAQSAPESQERRPIACHRVAMVGAPGVGKTALISQFQTSECINAYDRQRDIDSTEQKVSIMLNNEESELYFVNCTSVKEEIDRSEPPDAFVVIYSVVDKASFQKAEQELARLIDSDMLRARPALLVGNKIDLARSRAVSTQDGKCLACTYKAKFIEVSVGINHNVDELLVGILNQIRLKRQQYSADGGRESSPAHWYKSRGVVRASMKARQMLTWIFGKEDSKFKNCENLNVL
ncbi:ras-related protein Rap-2b [Melitaea cinxia]|uniref:ras-related protein Rap-2b n=1 Tax=Melitaea cinxia TaxID=113334 RepID=UPI001E26F04D|nr:ras-related protein Rap-2b [Melitaea cinxia]